METVAYFQLAQNYETSELSDLELNPGENLKLSGKTAASVLGITGTVLAGGVLATSPASAYGSYGSYGYHGCCRPVYYQPVVYRPVYYRPSCCYYPQYHSKPSHHYPHYYSQDYSHDYSYDKHYDKHADNGYHKDNDYHEIAFHPVTDPNLLKLGSSGEIVALLQQALLDNGFDPGPVDGLFGYQTKSAVKAYQEANGLLVDGIAGGQTLDSLGLAGAGA